MGFNESKYKLNNVAIVCFQNFRIHQRAKQSPNHGRKMKHHQATILSSTQPDGEGSNGKVSHIVLSNFRILCTLERQITFFSNFYINIFNIF